MTSEQTPAPSKRFLTPRFSSSSAGPSSQPFTQQQTPDPSSTLPRTLRFVTPAKQQKDGINTSLENETSLSSDPRPRLFTPRGARGVDAIDDVDGDIGFVATGSAKHSLKADLIDDTAALYGVQTANFETPSPRKRRRQMTVPSKGAQNEPVVISSSPSLSPSHPYSDASDAGDRDGGNQPSSDLEPDPEPDPDSPSTKPAMMATRGSRFKMTPSLGHTSTPLLDDAESRPVFRLPDPKHQVAAEMATILPDAFTPSRRRGRVDYLPGGLADTIRNSVLSIATEISHLNSSSNNSSGSGSSSSSRHHPDGKLVQVTSADVDPSGRAIIATAHDGAQWILPALQNNRRGGGGGQEAEQLSQQVQSLKMAGGFLLSASASHWSLPNIQTDSGEMVHFASHWDIPAG